MPLYMDNRKIGDLGWGKEETLAVPPGDHELYVKMDWCKSKPLRVQMASGETVRLGCGSQIKGLKLLLSAVYVFLPGQALYVRPAESS
jgi:hypothetical protein